VDRLASILSEHQLVGLDTPIFIYHFERHPVYLPFTQRILDSVVEGRLAAVTSVVTLMELTVQPLRVHLPEVADEYEVLLLNFPNLAVHAITTAVARRAADLRARHHLKPADALQVATCLEAGATLFITNDRELRSVTDMHVLYLQDLVG
jgi:predicted nucleic acid-binding protein